MFDLIAAVFVVLVSLTLIKEYRRTRSITLLSTVTAGNVLYSAVTPVIAYYAPESTVLFKTYLSDAGMLVDESGLIRVMLAATIFQLVCLGVALTGASERSIEPSAARDSSAVIDAAIHVGWGMLLLGLAGVVWLGLIYNGHPWGLYEISYAERSPLFREHSTQSFLMLVGMYGASQLAVVFLMTDRLKMAALILLLLTLHGLGIKSKFPVFWVLFVFMVAAIGERKKVWKLLTPILISALILLSMSVLRVVKNISDLPAYISMHQKEIMDGRGSKLWESEIPGPASIAYFVINQPGAEYTLAPLLEIPKLFIPKPVYDRGVVVSDVWTAKMLGSRYAPGLGFGWSLLCDGFLVAGWLGILLIAYAVAWLARYIADLKDKVKSDLSFIYAMACYTCGPLFFYGVRESVGGLIKALMIMAVLLWLPTLLLARFKRAGIIKHSE